MIYSFEQFVQNKKFLTESKIYDSLEFFPEDPDLELDPNAIEIDPDEKGKENVPSTSTGQQSTSSAASSEVLPNNGDTEYIVKSGDSISKILKKFQIPFSNWKKIYNLNKKVIGQDPNLIKPGMKLVIPGGVTTGNTSGGVATGNTPGKEQKKENTTKNKKEVLISDKTAKSFIPALTDNINKIDSSASNLVFNINHKLGCASFVNMFSDAVAVVNDAWKSRDTIDGTMIYDVFVNLTPEEIQDYVNIWNRIYSRSTPKKWNDRGSESQAIKDLMAKLMKENPLNPAQLKIGDICGIYYPPSSHHEEAFFEGGKNYFTDEKGNKGKGNVSGKTITSGKGWTFNTHLGIVGAIEKGKPVIIHAIPPLYSKKGGSVNIWADGIDNIRGGGKIVWVERPSTPQSSIKL